MPCSELFETNPVLAAGELVAALRADPLRWAATGTVLDEPIARLLMTGHGVPRPALRSWTDAGLLRAGVADTAARPWRPGVLGLVHGESGGCVVPLEVQPASSWRIARQLPLEPRRLLDLLLALLQEAKLLEPGVIPEGRAFAVGTAFPWSCGGTSMDIAAVLAILRCHASCPGVLERACALVEADGLALQPVERVEVKLQAFVRECGTGSLLIRHPGCGASAAFAAAFDEVWSVSNLAELARHLAALGIFASWSTTGPHGLSEADLVHGRLRELQHDEPDHEAIVRLARRALQCSWRDDVPLAIRHRPRLDLLRSLRHLGCYADALEAGEQWRQEMRSLGDSSSLEQIAEADLEFAAGLFDPADFERMLEVLSPWLERIDDEPVCMSPGLRVRLWNTAARAMIRVPRNGWEALLRRSLDLQARTDPAGLHRTRNYLIEGLLRDGRLDDAAQQIGVGEQSVPDPTSKAMLAFYRADLERRRGNRWVDESLEDARPDRRRANHPLGFYLQATAGQPGRAAADAGGRFRSAGQCFAFDAERVGASNVLWVLAHCMEVAADIVEGHSPHASAESLAAALAQPGLEPLRARLGPTPERLAQLRELLARLPWI